MPASATVADVATKIGPGLARVAIGGRVSIDGEKRRCELTHTLPGDCEIEILTTNDDDADSLYLLRHSAAHVMAEAIQRVVPAAQLVYGPPVDNGFYYDIAFPEDRPLSSEDFEAIEREMKVIIKEDRPFTRYDLDVTAGMSKLRDEGSKYKLDNAQRAIDAGSDTLSWYATGSPGESWEDLCRGPHLPSTKKIGAIKVMNLASSYWHGDDKSDRLTRVYGTAFFKKKRLAEHLEQLEEAKKRDHRVIGKQLGLFHIDEDVGQGLVLWTPAGAVVRKELQHFISKELRKQGYHEVFTPHIGKLGLYKTSGHFPYYQDSQFPPLVMMRDGARGITDYLHSCLADGVKPDEDRERDLAEQAGISWAHYPSDESRVERKLLMVREMSIAGVEGCSCSQVANRLQGHEMEGYLLRPMNCPHHIKIFASKPYSYRDLPVRLSEFGTVYRWEKSGELNGMIRVRGFTQDDAHIFCTPDQVQAELTGCLDLVRIIFKALGMDDYRVRVGMRGRNSDKYIGEAANWDRAEEACRVAAKSLGRPFTEEEGEAAFYGPKIDFIVRDVIGREWQLGTVQVDYNLPERFDLSYVGPDNRPHRPVMIHRAPFGSMERFVGVLIEHFAGAFPAWLSPVQVAVASVSEKSHDYAATVHRRLIDADLRAELDASDEKIGPKKHRLRAEQVNYILVVGEREAAEGTVDVSDRTGGRIGAMPLDQFVTACLEEVKSRSRQPVLSA